MADQNFRQNDFLSNNEKYDRDYDSKVNNFLEDLEEEIFPNRSDQKSRDSKKFYVDSKIEQYEDYYDDFSDDDESQDPPAWYSKKIENKMKIAKSRLAKLSDLACYVSTVAEEKIFRIEQDHNSPLCKLDYPRQPCFTKNWTNYWRFDCTSSTQGRKKLLFEHAPSATSTESKNILPFEFPDYVINAVEAFQRLVNEISSHAYIQNEAPTCSYIKLRSNYKKELLLVAYGKGLSLHVKRFEKWMNVGPGRVTNIVSVWCIDTNRSQKKNTPMFVAGDLLELRDKIGPVTLKYDTKTMNVDFNSIDVKLLAKTLLDFLSLTRETTVLEVGCSIGVLTLILAQSCAKAIGLNTLDYEVKQAQKTKTDNRINNASFLVSKPDDIHTNCLSFLTGCLSVAVFHLAPPYAKGANHVTRALRNCPTIWQVAVYGTMQEEFLKSLTTLTSHDSGPSQMGEEFVAVRSCLLDKSPVIGDAFDIVILFERKSLIEPKVELLGDCPTLNLKIEFSRVNHGDDKSFRPYGLPKNVKNEIHDGDDEVQLPVIVKMREKESTVKNEYDEKMDFDRDSKKRDSSATRSSHKNKNHYKYSSSHEDNKYYKCSFLGERVCSLIKKEEKHYYSEVKSEYGSRSSRARRCRSRSPNSFRRKSRYELQD